MFTGLIQSIGTVRSLQSVGGDVRIDIAAGEMDASDLQIGESVAVSGVCLTVVEKTADSFCADVSNETLSLTSLSQLQSGSKVNLERALQLSDRLGGHLVSGHVDGLGIVLSKKPDARSERWIFSTPKDLLKYIAVKGSIAVDGVSLTVNAVDNEGFEVNLVPHTISHTVFGDTKIGEKVNLEVDLLARYAERLLTAQS
jgi:riboflavin synthase